MARKFQALRSKLGPEANERIELRAREMLAEMPLHELRHVHAPMHPGIEMPSLVTENSPKPSTRSRPGTSSVLSSTSGKIGGTSRAIT